MRTLALFIMLFTVGCSSGPNEVQQMTPTEAYGMKLNDFAVIIDVREKEEIQEGMAKPALWYPMSAIERNSPRWQEFLHQHSPDKTLAFYCARGGRAGKVATQLAQEGYKVANIGGFSDWQKAGLPIKKPQD